MYQCKTCKCAVCSRWARTCVCVEAQCTPTGTEMQQDTGLLPLNSLSTGQALLCYAALVAHVFRSSMSPMYFPLEGPPR